MEPLVVEWVRSTIENAPALVIVAYVAYRLESRLGACIAHNNEVMDKLLARLVGDN